MSVGTFRQLGEQMRAGKTWRDRLDSLRRSASTFLHPSRSAAISNLASMPLTLAATGCFDAAFFQLSGFWGLLATAASLIYLERAIADEEVDQ